MARGKKKNTTGGAGDAGADGGGAAAAGPSTSAAAVAAGGQQPPPMKPKEQQQQPKQPGPQGAAAGGQQQPQQQPKPQPQQGPGVSSDKPANRRNKFKKAEPAAAEVVVAPTAAPAVQAAVAGPSTAPLSAATSTTSLASAATTASTDAEVAAAAAALAATVLPSAAAMQLAPNKGAGTVGRPIQLDVNYLALSLNKLVPNIYHYDVTIEPNMPKRFMPHVFEAFRAKNFPKMFIAFDGQKNAYAPAQLKLADIKERKITYQSEDESRAGVYMVNMKEVKDGRIETKSLQTYQNTRQFDAPARVLQALEIVLKSVFLKVKGVGVGRAFYRPLLENNRPVDLGDYYDLWTGLFQSTVLGSQPYLNVDIAHKAFPRAIPLVDLLRDMRCDPARGLDMRTMEALRNQLRGLRICFVRPNAPDSLRSYRFLDLGETAAKHQFADDTGKRMTVQAYFLAKHKLALKFPMLPCVRTNPADKGIHLPMEFCSVAANQAVMKKCTEMQTRNMIKQAATSTDVRRSKIMNLLREIRHNESPTLQQFGVGVAADFTTVKARVLNAPTLEYADKRQVQPRLGVWNPAGSFLYPVQLNNWALLILDQRANERMVYDLASNLQRSGVRNFNMQISENPSVIRLNGSRDADIDAKMNELRNAGCQLLICIISNFGDLYARVKQAAEIRCGILTQCIKEATVTRKCQDQSTISNILLKINAKLNGTNHKFADLSKLPVQRQPHMVIGADVTHPSPDQVRIPSVVGVAVSYDSQTFRYRMCWRLQNPKQEMIQDLESILAEQLTLFKAANKVLPRILFYYRDGVSDGQFQEVMRVELNAMHRAAQSVEPGYKPKVVFVVVQKRHHTRFFPKTRMHDRNNNVEAGTIVDSQITHPNETQFFLVSHASIQGVAKPTKYCLLRDDLGMSINDLETFTYNLCHMFTRCNRAVSYPAPTYYAHLAAYRGRVYIEGRNQINMDKLQHEYDIRRTSQRITNGNPMYFV